jgi:putative SOS response-associated peptidase YedK
LSGISGACGIMCGRFSLRTPEAELRRLFGHDGPPLNLAPRYNIAPTQTTPVIAIGRTGRRTLVMMRWGLIPAWARDMSIGAKTINARADGVAEKPAFRAAFAKRRCLVPADGFYEWQAGAGKAKQPYLIHRPDGAPFAFAGLWEQWRGPEAAVLTFTIITTEANDRLRPIHARMPAILAPTDHARWLDPATPSEAARALLRPAPDDALVAEPIGTRINNVKNDDPAVWDPPGGADDAAE